VSTDASLCVHQCMQVGRAAKHAPDNTICYDNTPLHMVHPVRLGCFAHTHGCPAAGDIGWGGGVCLSCWLCLDWPASTSSAETQLVSVQAGQLGTVMILAVMGQQLLLSIIKQYLEPTLRNRAFDFKRQQGYGQQST
jgi:hypothetical protein